MANEQPQVIQSPIASSWLAPSRVFAPVHSFQSRSALLKQNVALLGSPSLGFLPLLVNWQPADPAFGNSFVASNRDYLFARNNHASLARSVTLRSFPEPVLGRSGDIQVTLQAGEMRIFGPLTKTGWMQVDGSIYVDCSAADVQLVPVTFS